MTTNPRCPQAGGLEGPLRPIEHAGQVWESIVGAEAVAAERAAVRLPEDVIRPRRGLHALELGSSGSGNHQASAEYRQERVELVLLSVVDRIACHDHEVHRSAGDRA